MRQTGCGDGDHWGGQRLAGLAGAQPLVTLKINKNRNTVTKFSHYIMPSLKSVCLLSVCCFSVLRMQLLCAAEYSMWCLIFTTWCQYTFFFILLTCHIYSCFTNSFPTFPRIPTTSRENAWTCSEKHRWLMFCISKDQPESPMSSAVNPFLKQRPESPHFYWKYFLSSKLLG